jgi:hypothetical protein
MDTSAVSLVSEEEVQGLISRLAVFMAVLGERLGVSDSDRAWSSSPMLMEDGVFPCPSISRAAMEPNLTAPSVGVGHGEVNNVSPTARALLMNCKSTETESLMPPFLRALRHSVRRYLANYCTQWRGSCVIFPL